MQTDHATFKINHYVIMSEFYFFPVIFMIYFIYLLFSILRLFLQPKYNLFIMLFLCLFSLIY